MHSLETGIIVSIAAFFFLSFITFVILREENISVEISNKVVSEYDGYKKGGKITYKPELIKNVVSIINEGVYKDGEND